MKDARKPIPLPWIIPGALLIVLGGYVGAYYASMNEPVMNLDDSGRFVLNPDYVAPWDKEWSRKFNDRATVFFAPVHWLDRCIRSDLWGWTP